MTVTATGLVTKRFPELLQELQTNILNTSGNPNIDLSETAILGILNTVYATSSAESHELLQAIYAAGDIERAEGVLLDRLVQYIGITRLAGRYSTGFLYFTTTTAPTTVPAGTKVVSVNRDVALTESVLRINQDLCYSVVIDFTVQNSTAYTIRLNNTTYTYTSDSSATKVEIGNGIVAAITSPLFIASTSPTGIVTIKNASGSNGIRFEMVTNNVQIVNITSRVAARSEVLSNIEFPAGSINRLQTPQSNLSVVNLDAWGIGAPVESDDDLRLRHSLSTQLVGLRTEAAIVAKLLAIAGVEKVLIRDNVLDTTDPITGLPAHSFECVVKGGDNVEIGSTILGSKAAGIQTFGDITVNVADDSGVVREIKFSRPDEIIVWVKVQYELYDEEPAPDDIDSLIANQAYLYGLSLDIGEDVIPTRFLPDIYRNIDGLGIVSVTLGTSTNPAIPPVSYSAATIEIGEFEESSFSLNRVTVEPLL
jgi:uncharacterized phage protein gp47/JayE